jgi:hypothetical protein
VLTTRHPSIRKRWHYNSLTSGDRSVGVVRLRTKGHGVCLFARFVCFVTKLETTIYRSLLQRQQFPPSRSSSVCR